MLNQIPIRLESSIEIQNLRSDLGITRQVHLSRNADPILTSHSLSLPLSPRIQFSARRGRADRSAAKGRRTSPSYIREYFAEQNRKRSLRLSTVYIRQRAKLAKGEAGGGRGGRCADRCVFPATSEFVRPHNLSMRTGVRAAETAIDNDIQRCIHGKRIHNDGHCAQP